MLTDRKTAKESHSHLNNVKFNSHTSQLFKRDGILKFGIYVHCMITNFDINLYMALPEYFNEDLGECVEHNYTTYQTDQMVIPSVRHDFARDSIKKLHINFLSYSMICPTP